MKKIFSAIVLMFLSSVSFGQLTTTASTPANLVQNVLLGAGITATNINYTGYVNSIGEFSSPGSGNLGLTSGVILTTGSIIEPDPNPLFFPFSETGPFGPASNHQSLDVETPGDPDLDNISGDDTYNAAVLEFDFIPQSDTVKFRYVFGSEEYNDFVNGTVNDAFAFILSGVSTPLTATNIALIPGTTTPVSINTVNNGGEDWIAGTGQSDGTCENCAYFRDNWNELIDVTYDGLTVILTARHPVICGETYHIKIAIADGGDATYDSGVFLEAGSFSSSAPFTVASSVNGTTGITNAVEGCDDLQVSFVRPTAQTGTAQSFNINVGGTASGGSDYVTIPTTITFPIGVDTVTFDFSPVLDGINEGQETIILTVNNVNVCGIITSVDYNFTIDDMMPISAIASDGIVCPGGNVDITATPTGGSGNYTYTWSAGAGTTQTVNVSPATTTQYTVTIDDNCVGTAPVTAISNVTVVPPFVLSIPAQQDQYCSNATTAIVSASTVPVVNGFWNGLIGINNIGGGQATFDPSALPVGQTVLTYNAGEGSCTTTQDFTVTVNQFASSAFSLPVAKCVYDAPFTIAPQNTPGNWFLNGIGIPTGDFDPSQGVGTYQITYETGGTTCPDVTTHTITVNPKPEVTFSVPVTEGCLVGGNSFSFTSQVTSGTTTGVYSWLFGDGGSTSSLQDPVHFYSVPGSFTVKLVYTDVNGCLDDTTAVAYITVHPQPGPMFYISNENPTVIEPIVDFINATQGTNTYEWSVSGVFTTDDTHMQFMFGELGSYPITLKATNAFGCADSITQNIQLMNDQVFYIPSAFTPNNDGKNDVFVVQSSGVDTKRGFILQVYDRWGEKIFETHDYSDNWNGTKNNSGGNIIEGTYICKIIYTDLAGKQYARVEPVTVFK
ncbi:MAG: choice-of-anchor L domain-containing protein [Bacteroidota bacterium]|nr:choice-of-anchor L domain-containing protein [Bacteroidota bacterium]